MTAKLLRNDTVSQFVKFGVVGLSNTLISYITYIVCLTLLSSTITLESDYLVAQILQFLISVLWSYTWNRNFVFKSKDTSYSEGLWKAYVSYGFT